MNDDKDQSKQNDSVSQAQQSEETIHVKNPFKPGEEKEIDPAQLDREQEYKEASTERD